MKAIHEYFEANLAWEQQQSKVRGVRLYRATKNALKLFEERSKEVRKHRVTYKRSVKIEFTDKVRERIKMYQARKVKVDPEKMISIVKEVSQEYQENKKNQDQSGGESATDK